jgi:hypothetical protein
VLRLKDGLVVSGLLRAVVPKDGRVMVALLDAFEVRREERILFSQESPYPLALGRDIRTAGAGAPPGYFPATDPSKVTVPKSRAFGPRDRELITLFERAMTLRKSSSEQELARETDRILGLLDERHPDAWLLRWNLLEILTTRRAPGYLAERLQSQLEALEIRFDNQEPITTGLDYLRTLAASSKSHRAHVG